MTEREIFEHALEVADEQARAAYLTEVCGPNQQLREHLNNLLRAEQMLGSFLTMPALTAACPSQTPVADELDREALGKRIGPYKLLQQIGEGGFGVVYMAEQDQPVRRQVALKIIKPGMDTKEVIARFESERQALAMMDHPNIARVFDGGATENGRPYFVMELVKGVPITDYCHDQQVAPSERLEMFIQVCNAVQHAHQKGIIHRDLKPTNVMVTMHDGRPVPKVIDFGVAKATSQRLTERTLFTAYGQMIGTPAYMSPEQAELTGLDIDTRSDIYSLGVLLYELLTGTPPFEVNRFRQASFDEMRRIIREEEPETVSTRIANTKNSVYGARQSVASTPKYNRRAPRLIELNWIVAKSLEKDRERRYESAAAFALDLERYLKDEPIQACPPSVMYRIQKLVRQHRILIASLSAVLAALLIGFSVATWQAIRANQAIQTARARLAELEKERELPSNPKFRNYFVQELSEQFHRLRDEHGSSEAEQRLRQAITVRRQSLVDYPNDRDNFGKLPVLLGQLQEHIRYEAEAARGAAPTRHIESRLAEADSLLEEACAMQRQLVVENREIRADLAVTLEQQARRYADLAWLQDGHGRALDESPSDQCWSKAESFYAEVVAFQREFHAEAPTDINRLKWLGLRLREQAECLFQHARHELERNGDGTQAQHEKAEALLLEAEEIRKRLPVNEQRDLTVPDHQAWVLLAGARELANILNSDSRKQEAAWLYDRVMFIRRRLAEKNPGCREYRDRLLSILEERVKHLLGQPHQEYAGKPPTPTATKSDKGQLQIKAASLLTEAIGVCNALEQDFPDDTQYALRKSVLLELRSRSNARQSDATATVSPQFADKLRPD